MTCFSLIAFTSLFMIVSWGPSHNYSKWFTWIQSTNITSSMLFLQLGQSPGDLAESTITKGLVELYKPGLPVAVVKSEPAAIQRLLRVWCNPQAIIKVSITHAS